MAREVTYTAGAWLRQMQVGREPGNCQLTTTAWSRLALTQRAVAGCGLAAAACGLTPALASRSQTGTPACACCWKLAPAARCLVDAKKAVGRGVQRVRERHAPAPSTHLVLVDGLAALALRVARHAPQRDQQRAAQEHRCADACGRQAARREPSPIVRPRAVACHALVRCWKQHSNLVSLLHEARIVQEPGTICRRTAHLPP